MKSRLLGSCCLGLLLLTAGCSGPGGQASSERLSSLRWILPAGALSQIERTAPGVAHGLLASRETFVMVGRGGADPAGGLPTERFTSYAALRRALARHAIPETVHWLAYDPEYWSLTPLEEQRSPGRYMRLFARTAAAHGYRTILVPGRDLFLLQGTRCSKHQGETLDQTFVRCDLPAAARFVPVFTIQGAPEEGRPRELRRFVRASAREARRANPSVVVLVTLGIGAPGGADVSRLARTARAVLPFVDGFELNAAHGSGRLLAPFLRSLEKP